MKRVLVTGGAGFIGSHLVDALLARGLQVRVLDDLSTGLRSNLPDNVEMYVDHVADPTALRKALDDVDGCFHLAAVASVQRSTEDWLLTHRTNQSGAIAVFETIHRMGTRIPVVYASSAAVYGDCPESPITESAPKRPLSAYGADKLGCELHADVAAHVHGIPAIGLRFFNVYGPRQDPRSPYSGVISIFCQRILANEPIDIHGDGQQTRDFVYVGDVVQVLLRAMERRPQRVMNVCTGYGTTVSSLAWTIMEVTNNYPTVRHTEPRAGDIRSAVGSPVLAQELLGVTTNVPLKQGLSEVLNWMTTRSDADDPC